MVLPPPLEDPFESFGYEIITILQFSIFGLLGEIILSLLLWSTDSESCHNLGVVSCIIYFVIFIASCEQDYEILNNLTLIPPSESSQAVRIITDACIYMSCWDHINIMEILGFFGEKCQQHDHTHYISQFGPALSCLVFIVGSYIGCIAYLAMFRTGMNWMIGIQMVVTGLRRSQEEETEIPVQVQQDEDLSTMYAGLLGIPPDDNYD